MHEQDNPLKTVELSTEQNYNMIDGLLNNAPALPPQPPEKELDKVKEPPNKHRSGSVRSGDKETPPLCPSSCDGDAGGAGADWGTHGRGGHFQHGGLYAENGFEWLCASC